MGKRTFCLDFYEEFGRTYTHIYINKRDTDKINLKEICLELIAGLKACIEDEEVKLEDKKGGEEDGIHTEGKKNGRWSP